MVNGPQTFRDVHVATIEFQKGFKNYSWKSRAPFGWFIGQKFRGQKTRISRLWSTCKQWAGQITDFCFSSFWGCYNTAKVKGYPLNQKEDVDKNIDIYHIWWVDSMSLKTWCHRPCLNKKISSLWKKKTRSNEKSTSLSKLHQVIYTI